MAAKSVISGEYIIQQEEGGNIVVYRIFDNVKASLREVAELKGFQYDPEWNVRQFGRKLCKEYGDGKLAFALRKRDCACSASSSSSSASVPSCRS